MTLESLAEETIDFVFDCSNAEPTLSEAKAAYAQIKAYVLEHAGIKVSSLYIVQVKKQLAYMGRDIGYLEGYFSEGKAPDKKDIPQIITIFKLYEQQLYMYRNKVHSVPNRIVSISQSWIRPIVRGNAKAPVEFGAKLDVSIDEDGYGRLKKVSNDAYNESNYLIGAIERYRSRTGHCPERVLVDRHRMPESTKSRNIRITRTGLKWNGSSAAASVALEWDASLLNRKKLAAGSTWRWLNRQTLNRFKKFIREIYKALYE